MTEPIIIHDVDVSGCDYHDLANDNMGDYSYCQWEDKLCENCPNCLYKQLQREKRLHKHTQDLLDQALKDNEELGERLEKALLDNQMMCINSLNDDVCKLTQALTDIREIAESPRRQSNILRLHDCEEDLELILAKVKEVIE